MPRKAKYVQITANSKVYSCELKVRERSAPTVLRRIRRCFLALNNITYRDRYGRLRYKEDLGHKLEVNILRL